MSERFMHSYFGTPAKRQFARTLKEKFPINRNIKEKYCGFSMTNLSFDKLRRHW